MKTKLNIDGYSCVSCLNRIESDLKEKGVIEIDFDFSKKTAEIQYDEQKTSPAEIIKTIKALGYEASIRIFNMNS
jgi:copper chaperone CopZ